MCCRLLRFSLRLLHRTAHVRCLTARSKHSTAHATTPVSCCNPAAPLSSTSKGERGKARKGEGPRKNWEKVQVLGIPQGVGISPSRVLWDEYRN